jgi:hypothetical protein
MEQLIEQLRGLFQSNEAITEYGEDPKEWCDTHIPEETTPDDVAQAWPEVCEGLPQGYQDNCARYNASHGAEGTAATHTVVNEISYVTNTTYQQNVFIYAEEGSQVTNIQGDGNTVTQVDIDNSFNAEHPDSYDEYEEPHDGVDDEAPEGEEPPPEDGGYEEPPTDEGEEAPPEGEEGYEETPPEDGGYEEPPAEEPPAEEPPPDDGGGEEPPPPDDGAEAL